MKTICIISFIFSVNFLYSQFELRKVETENELSSFALCYSTGEDAWKTAVLTVEEIKPSQYRLTISFRASRAMTDDDKEMFENMGTLEFVFVSNGVQHSYKSKLSSYDFGGGSEYVELYFEDQKLIEYLQQYDQLYFYVSKLRNKALHFSLTNFSNCLKQL